MKNVIAKYTIPMKENNYYVRKAEIELRESKWCCLSYEKMIKIFKRDKKERKFYKNIVLLI